MLNDYSFLRDPEALNEIRKHQWIEGVKKGEPVGFATAALDWIKRYGQEFRSYHLEHAPAAC